MGKTKANTLGGNETGNAGLVSIGQAAKILGVSVDTIRRWDKSGHIHSVRPDGKNRYFSLEEIENLKFEGRRLTIGEASDQLNISPSTLRRLEEKGIVVPDRDENGDRLYDRETLKHFVNSDYFMRQKEVEQEVLKPLLPKDEQSKISETKGHDSLAHAMLGEHHITLQSLVRFKKWFYRSLAGIAAAFLLVVVVIAILFLVYPEGSANMLGYKRSVPKGKQYVYSGPDSLFARQMRPFSATALKLVELVNKGLRQEVAPWPEINDVNDVFSPDEDGNIQSIYSFTIPDSSYLKIPDTGLVANLNSDYLRGKYPGPNDGNLAILPINTDHIKDGAITLNKLAPGIKIPSGGGGGSPTLSDTGVTAGIYGSSTQVPILSVDSKGRLTNVQNATISGVAPGGNAGGDLSGTYPNPIVQKINGTLLGHTTATAGNLLIASGSSWVSQAVGGDVALSSSGNITINPNSVELGTDTTGNYIADISGSNGLTVVGSGSESASVTLSLDITTSGSGSLSSSNSGLELAADGLRLLGGCSASQILKWSGSVWQCDNDITGSGTGTLDVEEGDVLIVGSATNMDFLASDFSVVSGPGTEANVSIDYLNSGITRKSQAETITGNWTFGDSNFFMQDNADSSKKLIFELANIPTGTTRTLTVPTNTGTIITTGNLTEITTVGTVINGTWQGAVHGVAYGGTGNSATPTNGQLLIGNGAGYTLATITPSTNMQVTNGVGSISISTVDNPVFSNSVTTPLLQSTSTLQITTTNSDDIDIDVGASATPGDLQLGTTNAEQVSIGRVGKLTHINGSSNIATGNTAAETVTIGNNSVATTLRFNSGETTGTAFLQSSNALTSGTAYQISTDSLTSGKNLHLIGGSQLTTGNLLTLTGATYNPAGGSTGSLANLEFTAGITNSSGISTVNGINVAPTINSSGAGTKEINSINSVAPIITSCTGGTCTINGLKVSTASSGSASNITNNGLFVNASGVSSGNLNGLNISAITSGAGNESAIKIGRGWDNAINIDPSTEGTIIQSRYQSAATQTNDLTGLALDFNTNFTSAQNRNITGIDLSFPGLSVSGSVTNYTGLTMGSATNIVTNPGTVNWNGASFTMPNIIQTNGTITSNGVKITSGTMTTGGVQNAINIAGNTAGVGGTLNGINFGSFTPGGGDENGIIFGAGWDRDITSINGESLDIISGTTGALNLDTSSTGAINVGANSNAKTITIGNSTGASGMVLNVGTGNFSLNGVGASTYTIGAATTSGTLTIGGTAQTGALTIGQSSGTNILNLGTGTGATTVNIATGATNAKTVNIGTSSLANAITVGTTSGSLTLRAQNSAGSLAISGRLADGNVGHAVCSNTSSGNWSQTSTSCSAVSTRSSKENINSIMGGLEFINKLAPVSYNYKADGSKHYGFIAEDVAEIDTTMVAFDENGEVYGLFYDEFIALAIAGIKELDQQYKLNVSQLNHQQGLLIKGQADLADRVALLENYAVDNKSKLSTANEDIPNNSDLLLNSIVAKSVFAAEVVGANIGQSFSSDEANFSSGELVSLNTSTGKIYRSSKQSDSNFIGVISRNSALIINSSADNKEVVSISGIVPIKVSTANGKISEGDLITTSHIPGVGVKQSNGGEYIGVATSSYDGDGNGTIFVNLSAKSNKNLGLMGEIDEIKNRISNLEKSSTDAKDYHSALNSTDNTISSETLSNLTLEQGLIVGGPAEFKGQTLFHKLVIFIEKVIFRNDVAFEGRTTFNNDTAGFAEILSGNTRVRVEFSREFTSTPVVSANVIDGQFVQYSIDNVGVDGFDIVLKEASTEKIKFSWSSLQIENAKTFDKSQ